MPTIPLTTQSSATTNPKLISHQRQIALWLLICCALIFAMVVLGGVTRLTGSGLSMVEWDPLFGILPPLSQTDWQTVFSKYQTSPEFLKINRNMDLEGFKGIYWLEYLHRVLGRLIGIVFLLPFLYFWIRGKIRAALVPKLIILFILGGLQGVLGWYMVKSGLVDNPHVSQYRLTAHLMFGRIALCLSILDRSQPLVPGRARFRTSYQALCLRDKRSDRTNHDLRRLRGRTQSGSGL